MAARMPDLSINENELYKEELFTDRKTGSIRKMTPVKSDGTPDDSRKTIFSGQAQLMTPAGALPLAFVIEADDLASAASQFGALALETLEKTARELEELHRQQESKILVPGGGVPGGRIKMP